MSKVTRRKHVINEGLLDSYELPKDNQLVVKILGSKGNNLHEVRTPNGEEYLVSMPLKFRKNIWVKRGSFVLVEPILEGDKVKGEIVKIMDKESIKFFKENNVWPKEFDDSNSKEAPVEDDIIFVNTNRVHVNTYLDNSDSSEESDSGSCDESE